MFLRNIHITREANAIPNKDVMFPQKEWWFVAMMAALGGMEDIFMKALT